MATSASPSTTPASSSNRTFAPINPRRGPLRAGSTRRPWSSRPSDRRHLIRPPIVSLVLLALSPVLSSALHAESDSCPPPPSHIHIDQGSYSSEPGVSFELRHFTGTLVPRGSRAPSCFERTTLVDRADIFVSNQSLTNVFAAKLGKSDTRIQGLKIENSPAGVKLSGTIRKVMPLAFTIEGPVSTDGTSITMHAEKIKADGIPLKALLELVGEQLNSILAFKDVAGVAVKDDTISFSPEQVAHLKGNLVAVQTSPEGLTLHYAPRRRHPLGLVAEAAPLPAHPRRVAR